MYLGTTYWKRMLLMYRLTVLRRYSTGVSFNEQGYIKISVRIRIHLIRIWIQHFRLNTDSDPVL
jgi:hypothetical protein